MPPNMLMKEWASCLGMIDPSSSLLMRDASNEGSSEGCARSFRCVSSRPGKKCRATEPGRWWGESVGWDGDDVQQYSDYGTAEYHSLKNRDLPLPGCVWYGIPGGIIWCVFPGAVPGLVIHKAQTRVYTRVHPWYIPSTSRVYTL